MMKIITLVSFCLLLCTTKVQAQNKDYVSAGLYNIGFGGLVGGIGSVINKKPNQKTGKQFLKGFGQGAAGGYLVFESKRLIGQFAKTANYGYVWPAKLINSAGASIIENAAANAAFGANWHLNFGFTRLELHTKDSLRVHCRIMPFALGGVIYGFTKGQLAINETLKTGSFVFSSNMLYEKTGSLGRTAVNTIVYQPNNGIAQDELIVGHELIHTFQYENFSGFNTFLDKPLQKIKTRKPWLSKFEKLIYTDFNYPIFNFLYLLNKNHDSNLFEKEACFYTQ